MKCPCSRFTKAVDAGANARATSWSLTRGYLSRRRRVSATGLIKDETYSKMPNYTTVGPCQRGSCWSTRQMKNKVLPARFDVEFLFEFRRNDLANRLHQRTLSGRLAHLVAKQQLNLPRKYAERGTKKISLQVFKTNSQNEHKCPREKVRRQCHQPAVKLLITPPNERIASRTGGGKEGAT